MSNIKTEKLPRVLFFRYTLHFN